MLCGPEYGSLDATVYFRFYIFDFCIFNFYIFDFCIFDFYISDFYIAAFSYLFIFCFYSFNFFIFDILDFQLTDLQNFCFRITIFKFCAFFLVVYFW